MNTLRTKIIAILSALIIFLGGFGATKLGSVNQGQEYYSTTTGSFAVATSTYVRVGPGAIAQVTISSTTNVGFKVKDATSTLDLSSTTIANFPAGVAAGTYIFDASFTRGLFFDLGTGFAGSYTVTYR